MQLRQWLSTQPAAAGAPMPFSFVFAGTPAQTLLPTWNYSSQAAPNANSHVHRWQEPSSGLRVELEAQWFEDFAGAVYYFLRFHNTGDADTPVLEAIWPLDSTYALAGIATGAIGE